MVFPVAPGNRTVTETSTCLYLADELSYVERMSPRDLEPGPPFTSVGKVDSALAILIIIGIAFGMFWLVSSLASSYIGFFT
ncbi:hypothetical protein SSOG_07733 [Streptomyces himastatinicus ATCC 53653]|uniref:Uncharacterized protein n=2 Tax=Streptomyces TaxID=1883 RepID=D9WP46_9ACTN|nr:hypothetical protein SSOG_07733 [Streptomyces himastatinicus ATCC 53653]